MVQDLVEVRLIGSIIEVSIEVLFKLPFLCLYKIITITATNITKQGTPTPTPIATLFELELLVFELFFCYLQCYKQ